MTCHLQEPAAAPLGGAGPAYMRELSLLQRNTAAGAFTAHPVSNVTVRQLPGMAEDGVSNANTAGDADAASSGAGPARQQQ